MKNLETKTATVFGNAHIYFMAEMEHADVKDLEKKIAELIAGSELAGKLVLTNARKDYHLNVGDIDINFEEAMDEDEEPINLFENDLVLI